MKSKKTTTRKMREFNKLRKYEYNQDRNYLKQLDLAIKRMVEEHSIPQSWLVIMLYVYDLEFWTAAHVAKEMNRSERVLKVKFIYPCMKEDLVYKHFDKLSPGNMTVDQQLFYDENKYNYRIRYALTQRARLLVQRFYRMLEGDESI